MKKPDGVILKILLVAACLLLALSSPVMAKEVKIADFAVTNNRDDLLVFFSVKGAFTREMVEAIQNGIPTTFSYFVRLEEDKILWFKKKIAAKSFTHTIKYNNMKDEYVIKRSWDADKAITTKSFEQAKSLMAEIKSFRLTDLDPLEKEHRYIIRAKAELDKVTLPFKLHYILFFTALWDFETSWHSFKFKY
ncbi:MAG: DUF4390 domain-containing protein [Desulfobacterales bacterium]|nr:DUF4390 domain-containing protein [Desulfobacterales bacterium]